MAENAIDDVSAVGDEGLAEAIASGSREDAARALAPVVAGMLERRLGSPDDALEALPGVVNSVLSARRRLKTGSIRAGILGVLKGKAPGSPADGVRHGLAHFGEGAAISEAALAGDAEGSTEGLPEGLEELLLVAVEGLSFREAGTVTGAPAALVEKRASLALARIAKALAGP